MASHKRILSCLGNGPARRNLFGPVDREQLQAEYRAALHKDLEEASERWGFDFMSDKPLESSDFQWEGVQGARVPLLYRSCVLDPRGVEGPKAAEATAAPKAGRSEKENIPCMPERCAVKAEALEKTPEKRGHTGLKRKQTNLTDFYQAKKRVVGTPRKSGQ
ncbi:cyclin-dependent kinase inhibitor 1 isoform X2 [Mugil cephalus]|nr:cyclin-dependent kinase inhibitor 1 isoform X2 [Mugil cephalus]